MKGCGAHREERRGEESPTTPPLRCSRWVVVTWDKLKARTSRATRRNRYKKAHVPICTSDVCVCVCLSFGPLFSSSSSSSSSSSFFLISFLKRYKIPDLNICWFARCCLSFDLARDIIKFRPSVRPTDRWWSKRAHTSYILILLIININADNVENWGPRAGQLFC